MLKTNRAIPIVCLLAMGVFAAGVYLAPSHQEIALMQMDDFNFNTAFRKFTTLHGEGDRSINVLAPLINLNIYYGDVDQAIELLKSFVADHPRSVEGRKKLAELYKSSQRFEHYCDVLEDLQKLSPSAETLQDLAHMYSFLGRNKDEMSALARLIDSKGYHPQEEDYIQLASLYRMDHQQDEAIGVIRGYIEDRYYKVSIDAISLAIQLLQEANKEEKALSLARAYLKKHEKESDAIAISSLFEAHGQFDSAYAVLTPYIDNMESSTDMEQQVVDIMLAQKKDDDVYSLLSEQQKKTGVLAPTLAVALTDLAIRRNDDPMVETLIRTQDLEKMPEDALMRYAETAFRLKRPDLAQMIKSKLSADYLREGPVLAAILNVAANDTPANMAALSQLPHDVIVSPQAKIILASMYVEHKDSQHAFALLDNMPITDILDSFDAAQYAELYLDTGAGAKAERILSEARPTSSPEIQDSIDQALLLIAAGEGKEDYIRPKLAAYTGSASDLWPDAYDLAVRYHHNGLALVIADRLYKVDPTQPNRLQLAEALLLNYRYADAIGHLQTLVSKDAAARAMYLDALAAWTREVGGANGLPATQRASIQSVVESAIANQDMSPDERQDLAYVLEEIGMIDQAEQVLVALAGNQPYGTPDVEDLLGFWEQHPSAAAMTWVENRARHSSGQEKAVWLTYLNDNNHPQAVLDVLQDKTDDMSSAVLDEYIEALVQLHKKDKLDFVLEELIDTETNTDRLKKLAVIADDEDAQTASEKAWRKLLELNPSDDESAKEVGLLEYDAEHYNEAKPLLKQYLDHNQGDYQVNYAYGEILQQGEEKEDAKPYFERALQEVSDIKTKDVSTRIDEAYLLYRTGHITESTSLFRQLLAKYPDQNKEIRADFAEVLIEIGRFDEASALLSQ